MKGESVEGPKGPEGTNGLEGSCLISVSHVYNKTY